MGKSLEQLRTELRGDAQDDDTELDDGADDGVLWTGRQIPGIGSTKFQDFVDAIGSRKISIEGLRADFVIDEVGKITEGGIAPGLLPIIAPRDPHADSAWKVADLLIGLTDRKLADETFPDGLVFHPLKNRGEDT